VRGGFGVDVIVETGMGRVGFRFRHDAP
jgi:hypothetical protein